MIDISIDIILALLDSLLIFFSGAPFVGLIFLCFEDYLLAGCILFVNTSLRRARAD